MTMRTIALDNSEKRASVLGFGCSSMLGRVGRRDSLAALGAAYDAGINFFDTARSYGYGESEALLGEFLRGRRDSAVISTKFGILPAHASVLKRSLKPIARTLLQLAPGARKAMQRQLAAQSSGGHFSVAALHESLEASLRALRTDYVDMLFLHEPPVSAFDQDDLFAALKELVAAGKIRRFGIASTPQVIEAALTANLPGLHGVQFPCNLFDVGPTQMLNAVGGDVLAIANHPFGGAAGIAKGKALLASLAQSHATPSSLRDKLQTVDDAVLADVVLNLITRATGVQIVVPSMLRLDHLRANIAVIEHSRFSAEDLRWLRETITAAQTATASGTA
jgi:aryl-alcohol dehydrogenase-like predicted oxidoreductase